MIGIDVTRISRFRSMSNLNRFLEKFNVDGQDPVAAAKTWACMESLVKAHGSAFPYSKIRVLFPKNSAPQIQDPENTLGSKYFLSLSHEDDLVVAVAVRTEIIK